MKSIKDPKPSYHTEGADGVSDHQLTQELNRLLPEGRIGLAELQQCHPGVSIQLHGSKITLAALSSQTLNVSDVGRTVACTRIQSTNQIMVLGVVANADADSGNMLDQLLNTHEQSPRHPDDEDVFEDVYSDYSGEAERSEPLQDELVFEAGQRLRFRCGESSIDLSADGRVTIRGKFLNSRATQLNRLSGGSIKIN